MEPSRWLKNRKSNSVTTEDAWSEEAREAALEARRRRGRRISSRSKMAGKHSKGSVWVGGMRAPKGWNRAHTHAYLHGRKWGSHGDALMMDMLYYDPITGESDTTWLLMRIAREDQGAPQELPKTPRRSVSPPPYAKPPSILESTA
jgi:hypothetical protein